MVASALARPQPSLPCGPPVVPLLDSPLVVAGSPLLLLGSSLVEPLPLLVLALVDGVPLDSDDDASPELPPSPPSPPPQPTTIATTHIRAFTRRAYQRSSASCACAIAFCRCSGSLVGSTMILWSCTDTTASAARIVSPKPSMSTTSSWA